MKVSVVMTTYNGIRFLKEMLDSLKNQTRKIDEVIICDDRSTDNTVKFINEYIEVYLESVNSMIFQAMCRVEQQLIFVLIIQMIRTLLLFKKPEV